jgi:putative ABC transport system ATP-binding protein
MMAPADTLESRPNGGIGQPPVIAARGVHKTYRLGDQSVRALDAVSFEIRRGEYVAVVGPSGSGKSTMMHLMGALDVPTAGEVWIDGHDIAKLPGDELAVLRNRTIGFVFQQFNLLPRATALRQVMLPLVYARPRPKDAEAVARARLEQVGLGDRLQHGPQQLSGGQQQRVAIARALVNGPKVLLADEPTGALDTGTSESIMRLFDALNEEGITVVLVTHEIDVARHARRRIMLRDGRVVEDVPQSPSRLAPAAAAQART